MLMAIVIMDHIFSQSPQRNNVIPGQFKPYNITDSCVKKLLKTSNQKEHVPAATEGNHDSSIVYRREDTRDCEVPPPRPQSINATT